MSSLGQDCTEEEIGDIIKAADTLGIGRVDFPSFLKQFQHADGDDPEEFLQQSFDIVGQGRDIDGGALEQYFIKLKLKLIPDEVKEIMKMADEDKDGFVGLADFKKLFLLYTIRSPSKRGRTF